MTDESRKIVLRGLHHATYCGISKGEIRCTCGVDEAIVELRKPDEYADDGWYNGMEARTLAAEARADALAEELLITAIGRDDGYCWCSKLRGEHTEFCKKRRSALDANRSGQPKEIKP